MRLTALFEDLSQVQDVVRRFLSGDGRNYAGHDCKTVTRAFVKWAKMNGVKADVLLLAPPSDDFINKNPKFKGKSGGGDAHIMPVVFGFAVDFTARQFGLANEYHNPLITPFNGVGAVYGRFGYFTDSPDWLGGKSFYFGPLNSSVIGDAFEDELL